jgi:hypothetical protein
MPKKPSRSRIRAMIEEATVDAYDHGEQITGWVVALEHALDLPFDTKVLGVVVEVVGVEVSRDESLLAVCRRGRAKQRVPLADLPLPTPAPRGAEWIEAYRAWTDGSW